MVDSDYSFISGEPIEIGNHGQHSYLFESGEPVVDSGKSDFVFESGVGLDGFALTLGDDFVDQADPIYFNNGDPLPPGEYQLTVQANGRGWTLNANADNIDSNYYCDVDEVNTGSDIYLYGPCNFLVDPEDEWFGPYVLFDGADGTSGNEGVKQTDIFTTKDLEPKNSYGEGTFTTTTENKIGLWFKDSEGAYGDNDASLDYSLIQV